MFSILQSGDPFMITVFIVSLLACFYMAWNIGANDVANAMGTSVGAKAITLKQAVLIAAVFEFLGATFVGAKVTSTISKGIVDPSFFADTKLFIIGMLVALIASGIWLHLATFLGWPVSTTHSIVGAVVGFGVAAGGSQFINWIKLGSIATSWVLSPVLGAIMAFVVFKIVEALILERDNPVKRARRLTPFFAGATVFVLVLALIFEGLKNLKMEVSWGMAALISLGISVIVGIIAYVLLKKLKTDEKENEYKVVEGIFKYLQVMTACYVAFAHGANDVANAIGPLAGIVNVMQTNEISAKAIVPIWILVLGGTGIVVGIATWGYKVIGTIGEKITEMTPTRGFSAELATATTVLAASQMGLPISTTHTLVGAVIGVALGRGLAALNVKVVRDIFASWIITIPFTALLTAGLFKLVSLFI